LARRDWSTATRFSDNGDAKVVVEIMMRTTKRRNGVAMRGSVAIAESAIIDGENAAGQLVLRIMGWKGELNGWD
jgi:hypothetical protein